MPSTAELAPATATFAHPVLEHSALGLPAPLIASVGAWAVLVVALAMPEGRAQAAVRPPTTSWQGTLTRAETLTRVVSVLVLLVAVVAGRIGADDQLENIAPALVVGAAWPLLVLASALAGPIWRWCDPWDALARPLTAREPGAEDGADAPDSGADSGAGAGQVWPAAALALGWVWFLSASPDPLDPRALGTFLAVYTAITLAGCVAFGRRGWLSRAEPLGIVLTWLALLPRGRLVSWTPPPGAEALLGVLVGGLAFGGLRRTQQWTSMNAAYGDYTLAWAYSALGLLVSCAVATAVLLVARRLAGRVGGGAAVARAMVPAVAGIVVATAMSRNRLTTSVQLLPGLVGDPFGRGWDLLGAPLDGLDPAPFGTTGLLFAQLGVLLVAHLAGAIVMGRGLDRAARVPAVAVLAASMVLATVAVPLH